MARSRMPSRRDVDSHGLVKMVIKTKQGEQVRMVSPVDAREIILSDSGQLDIPEELENQELARNRVMSQFEGCSLDELRSLCQQAGLSYTGKRPDDLKRMLIDAGVTFEDEDEPS